jgi:predicted CxxxxCH...CXXCH cytochrome family protein
MPRPRRRTRRPRRPRALIGLVALAALAGSGCADERAPAAGCRDCGIHPVGILDEASPDFHGADLERRGWDFALCGSCHGDDFAGGTSGVSCLSCHAKGPTACDTCHAERPETGAHPAHLGVGSPASYECGECHEVPARWDADGHILRGGVADPAPAEVRFAGAAAQTPAFAVRRAAPSYDPATATCSDVYCHGDALADGGATLTRPRWSATGTGQADCGTCHGDPPDTHAGGACASCHPASAPHIDGVLAIGTSPGCGGCHGSDETGAPPRDLSGNQLTSALGVGAHQRHLQGGAALRGPLACAECHAVPSAVTDPGHIDTPPPAEVALVGGGAWNRTDATCATWCHGESQPVWTRVGDGQVFCGSCHGIPPVGAPHTPDLELPDCAGCHAGTVDAFGFIRRSGPPGAETSLHMDGHVDFD